MRIFTITLAFAALLFAIQTPVFANTPTLATPANAATAQGIHNTVLAWNAEAGAVSYTVEIADNPNFFQKTTWTTAATTTQQAAGELLQFTTYYWRVSARIGSTDTPFSNSFTFTTDGFSAVPSQIVPANNAINQTVTGVTLSWNSLPDVTLYRVEWADNQAFANYSWIEITGATTTTTPALTSNTVYYWRVKAQNTGGSSAWSPVRQFTTTGFATAPTQTLPANNAVNQPITGGAVRWNALSGATSYLVWWADNPDFVGYGWRSVTTTNAVLTGNLQNNTTYYWKVYARNALGESSPWSTVRTFTTTALNAPAITAPADGATGLTTSGATLTWTAATGATSYSIEMANNPNFAGATTLSATTTSKTTGFLNVNTTYYLRLKSINAGGTSTVSPTTSFSTAAAGTQAVLVNPANLTANIATNNISFSWNALAGATNYTLEYADNPSFTNSIINNATATNLNVSGLVANTNYYWRVKANGINSAVWTFSTAANFPTNPILNIPTNNSVNIATNNSTISWAAMPNASNYEIQVATNSNFSNNITTFNTTATSQNLTGLTEGINYYWRVRASNLIFTSNWSTAWKFTTETFATPAALIAPSNNALNAAVASANFSWNALPNAVEYDLQISENNIWTSNIRNYSVTNTSKTVDTFAQNTTYYWRVRGRNALTNVSDWSAAWQFKTTQLATPTLVTPINNTQNIPVAGTTLSFNNVPNSANYEIEIAPTPTFNAGVISRTTLANNLTTTTGNLQADYEYYWRVRGVNVGGNSPWSPVWSFHTVDLSVVSISTAATQVCLGNSLVLTAAGGLNYAWSNGNSGANITVNPTLTTTYIVTVTKINGTTATASQTITVNNLPNASITGATAFCAGNSTVLTANSSANTYLWSNNSSLNTTTISQGGVYTVTVTDNKNCSKTATINIIQNALPTVSITGNTAFCTGSSTQLTAVSASGASNFQWNNGSSNANLTVSQAGNYSVIATNTNGCSKISSISVSENALPTVSITGNAAFCTGSSTQLTAVSASGASNFQWNNGSSNANLTVSQAGNYSVIATNANGCSKISSISVSENALPTVSITGNAAFCTGSSTQLTAVSASGASSFQWNNGSSNANLTVSQAGNYSVIATNANGCSKITTVNVSENALPTVAITGNTAFCTGSSTQLTAVSASGASNFLWNNGSTNVNLTVSQVGNYSVIATNANGCSKISTINISENALPIVEINGDRQFCIGASLVLSGAGNAHSFAWSTGSMNTSITVSIPDTYTVTATDLNGCTQTAFAEITSYLLPNIQITGNSYFCATFRTIVTASGGVSYVWSNNLGNMPTAAIGTAGVYSVIGTDIHGCQNSMYVTVTQAAAAPMPAISQLNDSLFAGINVPVGGTISWYYNNVLINTNTTTIPIYQTGNYRACVTNADGCQTCSPDFLVTYIATENIAFGKLVLAPNPADNYTHLKGLPETGYTLRIFNSIGELIETRQSDFTTQEFNTESFSTGVYRVVVTANNQQMTSINLLIAH